MEKVSISQALPGMILARPVFAYGSEGKELINKGVSLERRHIIKLQEWGVEFVTIETPENNEDGGVFFKPVRQFAEQTYKDALEAMSRLNASLLQNEETNVHNYSASVRSVFEVISLEPDIMLLLSRAKRDSEYIYRHSVDTCIVSLLLGEYLKLPSTELHMLGEAALLHDIGLATEVSVDWDAIHSEEAPNGIKNHPIKSYEIAKSIKGISEITLNAILEHHENMDGSGYPHGYKEGEIGVLSSILAVAETYATFTCPFNLKNSMNPYEAVQKIMNPKQNKYAHRALRALIGRIAIFPVGSYVCLDDGSRGIVIGNNKDKPLRPKVLLLYKADSTPFEEAVQIDLSKPACNGIHVDGTYKESQLRETIGELVKI